MVRNRSKFLILVKKDIFLIYISLGQWTVLFSLPRVSVDPDRARARRAIEHSAENTVPELANPGGNGAVSKVFTRPSGCYNKDYKRFILQ